MVYIVFAYLTLSLFALAVRLAVSSLYDRKLLMFFNENQIKTLLTWTAWPIILPVSNFGKWPCAFDKLLVVS